MNHGIPGDLERNLLPSRVLDLAMMGTLEGLVQEITTGHVLIIRVASVVDPLAVQLAQTYGAGLHGDDSPQVLDFHTQLARTEEHPTLPPVAGRAAAEELLALRRFVRAGPSFVAPLLKRAVATMTENITVGRAINKDLVLRTQGVSKLHAWFELQDGRILVCDAGSKNGTFIGGRRLPAREPTELPVGDTVTFATIDVMLCTVATFWRLLRS